VSFPGRPRCRSRMLFNPVSAALVAACASCALAHGTHDQTPVSGPHKSLWYNTLPGDGGTQVRETRPEHRGAAERSVEEQLYGRTDTLESPIGRFCLLWHLNLRPAALLPVPEQRRGEIRHCVHRCVLQLRIPRVPSQTDRREPSPEADFLRSSRGLQALHSTQAPRTGQAPGSDPAGSDKVLDASTSSTSPVHTLTWDVFEGSRLTQTGL
jgi:hypothetical protein